MKNNTLYTCSKCDAQYTKWTGRCLECGAWGTIKENSAAAVKVAAAKNKKPLVPAGKTLNLGSIIGKETARLKTGIEEFDRVLGGGFAPGSLILLGGEPGIGKSTLVLQIASCLDNDIARIRYLAETKQSPKQEIALLRSQYPLLTLYISGEESAEQVKIRFDRLGLKPKNLEFLEETNVETICATIENLKPALAIVDSIQTISSVEIDGPAGNPTQIKAVCAKLMETAKSINTPIIIIGHVTKEGTLSGPKTLEHLVDTVLYLEGERHHQFRILRAVKNRFGSTNEIGVFEMKQTGLQEVKNPSVAFLSGRNSSIPGSAVTCVMEGNRSLLLEIQALVTRTQFGYPQRRASGFDLNRLQVLIAVLAKRTGLPLETHDIFINVVGGLKADEPAADLAVVLAIASALKNKTLPQELAGFGEIGLGGEVRQVTQTEKRLMEIKKMGFKFAVIPPTKDLPVMPGLKIATLENVKEIVEKIIK